MKGLKIRIEWFKCSENSMFHKIICFIFPNHSPMLRMLLLQNRQNNKSQNWLFIKKHRRNNENK